MPGSDLCSEIFPTGGPFPPFLNRLALSPRLRRYDTRGLAGQRFTSSRTKWCVPFSREVLPAKNWLIARSAAHRPRLWPTPVQLSSPLPIPVPDAAASERRSPRNYRAAPFYSFDGGTPCRNKAAGYAWDVWSCLYAICDLAFIPECGQQSRGDGRAPRGRAAVAFVPGRLLVVVFRARARVCCAVGSRRAGGIASGRNAPASFLPSGPCI